MDQESAAASGATLIPLNEHEQRYYSGLHALCQADSSGGLSSSRVAELFKASQLPPEPLQKVTEICGAKHQGYFGTTQFYVALKLLAAAQSGLPICLESVTVNLPLPRFVGLKNEPEMRYSSVPASADTQGTQSGSSSVAWTPADRTTFRHLESNTDKKKEAWSPPRSPCSSPPRSPLTYHSYPYTKQRNGVETHITYESPSRAIVQLDQHFSTSCYGNKHTVEHPAVVQPSSAEAQLRLGLQGTAVDYSDDDPWRITAEQLEYYTNQFKSLQPDLGALILGAIAKNFFTKSKLPIPELSHIWELSDVDRDGALTFSEFCIAFHLIVARKNGYPLPESLPPTLQPGFTPCDPLPETPENSEPLILFVDAEPRPHQGDRSILERLQPGLSKQELEEESVKEDGRVKSLTSSQEKASPQLGGINERPEPPQDLDPQIRMKTRQRSYSSTSIEDAMKKTEEPPTPPPRPQKTHSRASSLDLNKLLQQGAPGVKSGWLLPPALPPRPTSSQVPHFLNASEKSPLNKVQQPNFADFSHFREEEESSVKPEDQDPRSRFGPSTEDLTNFSKQDISGTSHGQVPQKPVRRKYLPESQSLETGPPPAVAFLPPTKPSQKLLSRQKREIQMAIRKNRESNAVLKRLNSELQQQLKVVHKERVTLESQLELLRPLTSM